MLQACCPCEEPIDLSLKSSEPVPIIEAVLTDADNPAGYVLIQTTQAWGDTTGVAYRCDATVVLRDDLGRVDTFLLKRQKRLKVATEEPSGLGQQLRVLKFATPQCFFVPPATVQIETGRTYTLEVTFEGTTYTASSFVYPAVEIDTLTLAAASGNKVALSAAMFWPAQVADAVLIQHYKNWVLQQKKIDRGLFTQSTGFFELREFDPDGDTVLVESIGAPSWLVAYFDALDELSGGNGGPFEPPPWNPPTNWSGNALGYFRASAIDREQIILPTE